jgi:hypothetical protein
MLVLGGGTAALLLIIGVVVIVVLPALGIGAKALQAENHRRRLLALELRKAEAEAQLAEERVLDEIIFHAPRSQATKA